MKMDTVFNGIMALSSLVMALFAIPALFSYYRDSKNRRSRNLNFQTRLIYASINIGTWRNFIKLKKVNDPRLSGRSLAEPSNLLQLLLSLKGELETIIFDAPSYLNLKLLMDIYASYFCVINAIRAANDLEKNPTSRTLFDELEGKMLEVDAGIRNAIELLPNQFSPYNSTQLADSFLNAFDRIKAKMKDL